MSMIPVGISSDKSSEVLCCYFEPKDVQGREKNMIELRPGERQCIDVLFSEAGIMSSGGEIHCERAWTDDVHNPAFVAAYGSEGFFVAGKPGACDVNAADGSGPARLIYNSFRLTGQRQLCFIVSGESASFVEACLKESGALTQRVNGDGGRIRIKAVCEGESLPGGLMSVLGTPVAHSKSPMLFNRICAERKLPYVYTTREIKTEQELGDFVCAMRDNGYVGCNVTMPWKKAVIPFLDELSATARLTESVNTVAAFNGHLFGHSTDGYGMIKSIEDSGRPIAGSRVVLLGAGGAARAIAAQCAVDKAQAVTVVSREGTNKNLMNELVGRLKNESYECGFEFCDFGEEERLSRILNESDVLINGTSVGMKPCEAECPLPDSVRLNSSILVADAVYNPIETVLLKKAAAAGCKTVNGTRMLYNQAVGAADVFFR